MTDLQSGLKTQRGQIGRSTMASGDTASKADPPAIEEGGCRGTLAHINRSINLSITNSSYLSFGGWLWFFALVFWILVCLCLFVFVFGNFGGFCFMFFFCCFLAGGDSIKKSFNSLYTVRKNWMNAELAKRTFFKNEAGLQFLTKRFA